MQTFCKRRKVKHKEERKEDRKRAGKGREWPYQENADVSTYLLAIYMVVLLGNGESFHEFGPYVDEW
jgi:hypothetical protein